MRLGELIFRVRFIGFGSNIRHLDFDLYEISIKFNNLQNLHSLVHVV